MAHDSPKICIVGQNASLKYGGEASIPWHYFKYLRRRGIDVHLVVHGRTRPELLAGSPNDHDRLHFCPETRIDRFLWRCGSMLPHQIDVQTFASLRQIYNQRLQKKIVRRLIAEKGIEIVHEITPVSPRQISLMYGLGVPVVIGPLAGGMTFPPAFVDMDSRATRVAEACGRAISRVLTPIFPGKRRAAALIVANDRARGALPRGVRGKIFEIPDVGVDLSVWNAAADLPPRTDDAIRFVYLGRLTALKGLRFLIAAFQEVAAKCPGAVLDILGDGEQRRELEDLTRRMNLADRVHFAGWVSSAEGARRLRQADVLILPSLREVGGMVLLEAMALGLPIIATDWGGPAIHVTDATGIRVPPTSPEAFVRGLSDAMLRLAESPDLRRQMGRAGMERVRSNLYDWDQKAQRLLEIYAEILRQPRV